MTSIKPFFTGSIVSAATTAAFVGFAGSVALILKAAEAVNANQLETTSWIVALCVGGALTSLYLTWKFRVPAITAWSTPGAALIATSADGISIEQAVVAFAFASLLVVLTMSIKPLSDLLKRIPSAVAAAMLAGILIQFCLDVVAAARVDTWFVLTLVLLFFVIHRWRSTLAVPSVLLMGIALSVFGDRVAQNCCTPAFSTVVFIEPAVDWSVVIGLGLPLFFVTMASQNLAGLAVLRADGYTPPPAGAIVPTGIVSILLTPFGGHGVCLAAITASICSGPSCHPDSGQRWRVGLTYALCYVGFAAFAELLVEFLLALPGVLITTFAGLALFNPLRGSLVSALSGDALHTEAAVLTFVVTVSGVSLFGVGSAFWGLRAGCALLGFARKPK